MKNAKIKTTKGTQPNEDNWKKYRGSNPRTVPCANCGRPMTIEGGMVCWLCNSNKLEEEP